MLHVANVEPLQSVQIQERKKMVQNIWCRVWRNDLQAFDSSDKEMVTSEECTEPGNLVCKVWCHIEIDSEMTDSTRIISNKSFLLFDWYAGSLVRKE